MLVRERIWDFVSYVIERSKKDTGFRARFVVANNPDLEYRVWPYLVEFCDIEDPVQRSAFALVGSYIARARLKKNGDHSLGEAIRETNTILSKRQSISKSNWFTPGEMRLQRIISCHSKKELIDVLRRIFPWIVSSRGVVLDNAKLLRDILEWGEAVKLRWVKEFYKEGINVDNNSNVDRSS